MTGKSSYIPMNKREIIASSSSSSSWTEACDPGVVVNALFVTLMGLISGVFSARGLLLNVQSCMHGSIQVLKSTIDIPKQLMLYNYIVRLDYSPEWFSLGTIMYNCPAVV